MENQKCSGLGIGQTNKSLSEQRLKIRALEIALKTKPKNNEYGAPYFQHDVESLIRASDKVLEYLKK